MIHRVRTHHLRLGRMNIKDHMFDTIETALAFANSMTDAESVKVYNQYDQITHDLTPTAANTYA